MIIAIKEINRLTALMTSSPSKHSVEWAG